MMKIFRGCIALLAMTVLLVELWPVWLLETRRFGRERKREIR